MGATVWLMVVVVGLAVVALIVALLIALVTTRGRGPRNGP